MTRYARGGQANKKKVNEATSWAEMKADMAKAAAAGARVNKWRRETHSGAGDGRVITRLKNGQYVVRIGAYERVLRSEAELRQWKRAGSERRRLDRKRRREDGRVCFLCRQPGHMVADCPDSAAAAASDATCGGGRVEKTGSAAVCFRCGAVDHALSACPKMPRSVEEGAPPPDLPFASCFVCGRSGHLSRACPDNPRGLYPKGGGCLLCSSVEHFKRDCPMAQKRRAADTAAAEVALPTASSGAGVDDEVPLLPAASSAPGDEEAKATAGMTKSGTKKRVKVVVL